MGPPSAKDLWDNPLGTDGFEFIEYAAPDPAALGRLFSSMGFTRRREAPLEERAPLPPGRHQLHRQRRAGQLRAGVRARAWPVDLRDRVPRKGFGVRVSQVRRERRVGRRGASRADGAQHPGDQGHRRFADLSRRPLRRTMERGVSIYDIDFVPLPGVDSHPKGAGLTTIDHLTHNVHRGRMDEWAGFYERLFNFREIRYFDIEGTADRPQVEGDDEPLRQDPDPDQREQRRQEPDPGIPDRLSRRGHPARRARDRRHLRHRRNAAQVARRFPGHAGHVLRSAARRVFRDTRRTRRGCSATASCWTARPPRTRCCCRSSPRR